MKAGQNGRRAWRSGLCALFCNWEMWYDYRVMGGQAITASSEMGEREDVNVPETEEYLRA